jgi:hypothetical protein
MQNGTFENKTNINYHVGSKFDPKGVYVSTVSYVHMWNIKKLFLWN